jgi:hypothetical protein
MVGTYRDRWIECTPHEIRVRWYYFPWGTKVFPYSRIREVRRLRLDLLHGKWRISGTANPRYWASLDPSRPRKQVGFLIDVGRRMQALITPDDADAFATVVGQHVDII